MHIVTCKTALNIHTCSGLKISSSLQGLTGSLVNGLYDCQKSKSVTVIVQDCCSVTEETALRAVNKYVFTSVLTRNDWVQTYAHHPSQNNTVSIKTKVLCSNVLQYWDQLITFSTLFQGVKYCLWSWAYFKSIVKLHYSIKIILLIDANEQTYTSVTVFTITNIIKLGHVDLSACKWIHKISHIFSYSDRQIYAWNKSKCFYGSNVLLVSQLNWTCEGSEKQIIIHC